jgi:hypothetical protein
MKPDLLTVFSSGKFWSCSYHEGWRTPAKRIS